MDKARYHAAIERNGAEIQRAIANREALLAIESAGPFSNITLKVLYFALFNDYLARCIKVFERSSGAASFWYLRSVNAEPIDLVARARNIDLAEFEKLSQKLKHIRDKTHFHIDREGVLDPKAVWREADLKGATLSKAVDDMWAILTELRRKESLPLLEKAEIEAGAVKRIAKTLETRQGTK